MPYLSKLTKRLALAFVAMAYLTGCAAESATDPGNEPTPNVASVRVMPESLDLAIGATQRLVAEVRDNNGRVMTTETVTWTSSDTTVAIVDASGTITALREGAADITGSSRGKSGRSRLRSTDNLVASVTLTPASDSLVVGEAVTLVATTRNSSGSILTGRAVTFSTSAAGIATVDATGRVQSVGAGSASITAASEGQFASASIAVVAAPPPPPSAPGTVADLTVTATSDTTATLRFTEVANGTGGASSYEVRYAPSSIAWSTATPVARGTCAVPMSGTTVGAQRTCVIRGLLPSTSYQMQLRAFRGTLGVDAVQGASSNVASGTTALAAVASVALAPNPATATVGGTRAFTATLRDAAGNVLTGRAITWSSTITGVATVSSSGVATGVSAGTATIRATSGGITGSATLTVTAPVPNPVATVTLAPATASIVAGTTRQFTATLRDAAGATLTGRTISWNSTTTTTATVNGSGLASGMAEGTTTISATSEGITGQATLTVTAPPPPPPPGSTILDVDWGATTGNTSTAMTDGGLLEQTAGDSPSPVFTVVSGTTVGFTRTTNVGRVRQIGEPAVQLERANILPQSTTHYGRFYFRNDEIGTWHQHPTAYNTVGSIQLVPFNRYGTSSGVFIGAQLLGFGYPYQQWGPVAPLANGTWYRYEWQIEYVSASTYRFHPRVYNMAGTLILDDDDFMQADYSGSGHSLTSFYAAGNVFTLSSPALARSFGLGNEGPAGSANTGGYYYFAALALSTSGWIGQ